MELLDRVLKQFERELSHPLPDNTNFPPEVEALLDPSADEYMTDNLNQEKEEERCSVPL